MTPSRHLTISFASWAKDFITFDNSEPKCTDLKEMSNSVS
jgi:hypothetical protein